MSFCGSGLGAFVLPPVLRYCVDSYELNTAFFLFAACTFQVSIAGMLFRPPQFYVKRYNLRQSQLAQAKPPNTTTSVLKTTSNDYAAMDSTPQRHWGFGWMLLCNPLMWLYAITLAICDSSYVNLYIILPPHATMTGFSKTKGAYLISLLGITQTVSRVVFGWFAHLDIIDNRYIYQCTLLVCGATFCVMPFLQSYVLLATGSVLCSLSAGSFVVLSAVHVAESLGTANLPTTYGILYST